MAEACEELEAVGSASVSYVGRERRDICPLWDCSPRSGSLMFVVSSSVGMANGVAVPGLRSSSFDVMLRSTRRYRQFRYEKERREDVLRKSAMLNPGGQGCPIEAK